MNDMTKLVIATAMRKMFEKGWLDICTVDQCLRVSGILAPKQPYDLLRTLHCVHFAEMPRELAEQIPAMLTECFSGLHIEDLMKACEPAQGQLTGKDRRRLN